MLRFFRKGRVLWPDQFWYFERWVWVPVNVMEQISGTDAPWIEFQDRLRAFVARRVKQPADVDDILQEVFLKIHRHLGSIKQKESLIGWMFQVTKNSIMDHYRSRRNKEETLVEDLLPTSPILEGEDFLRETRELAVCLSPMIRSLPETYQKALVMTDLGGLTQQAAAEAAGISLSGMKSRVQRARRQLKETLLECCRIEVDRRGGIMGFSVRDNGNRSCNGCSQKPLPHGSVEK